MGDNKKSSVVVQYCPNSLNRIELLMEASELLNDDPENVETDQDQMIRDDRDVHSNLGNDAQGSLQRRSKRLLQKDEYQRKRKERQRPISLDHDYVEEENKVKRLDHSYGSTVSRRDHPVAPSAPPCAASQPTAPISNRFMSKLEYKEHLKSDHSYGIICNVSTTPPSNTSVIKDECLEKSDDAEDGSGTATVPECVKSPPECPQCDNLIKENKQLLRRLAVLQILLKDAYDTLAGLSDDMVIPETVQEELKGMKLLSKQQDAQFSSPENDDSQQQQQQILPKSATLIVQGLFPDSDLGSEGVASRRTEGVVAPQGGTDDLFPPSPPSVTLDHAYRRRCVEPDHKKSNKRPTLTKKKFKKHIPKERKRYVRILPKIMIPVSE